MSSLAKNSEIILPTPPKMMLKVRQGLALQQSPKYPGLVRRFLQQHQVLNLTEGYQHIKPLIQLSGNSFLNIKKFGDYLYS
jgi:hypothetical protein